MRSKDYSFDVHAHSNSMSQAIAFGTALYLEAALHLRAIADRQMS